MFRPQRTLKKTRIKLHNTLALSAVLYGTENWTIDARDAKRITASEMKYVRKTVGYTSTVNAVCPTRYRTWLAGWLAGWRTAAPCRNN